MKKPEKNTYLSVIIPFFNESTNLPLLHEDLINTLKSQDFKSEIIYVNDGSTDNSQTVLSEIIKLKPHPAISAKVITFLRNFGQTAAISAGIDLAQGEIISFLDADLQNSPSDILSMLKILDKDTDVVFGWRKNRQDVSDRVLVSKIANLVIRKLFHVHLHDTGCAIKVVRKNILTGLRLYGESHRILGVLLVLRGAKYKEMVVAHNPRIYEKSKYGYSRFFKLIIDLLTTKFLNSYSTKPSYVFGTLGIIFLFGSFISVTLVAYRKLFLGVFVHRDPLFLIAIVLLLIGLQLILMGLLAELVVRVYFETRQKPIYETREVVDF